MKLEILFQIFGKIINKSVIFLGVLTLVGGISLPASSSDSDMYPHWERSIKNLQLAAHWFLTEQIAFHPHYDTRDVFNGSELSDFVSIYSTPTIEPLGGEVDIVFTSNGYSTRVVRVGINSTNEWYYEYWFVLTRSSPKVPSFDDNRYIVTRAIAQSKKRDIIQSFEDYKQKITIEDYTIFNLDFAHVLEHNHLKSWF